METASTTIVPTQQAVPVTGEGRRPARPLIRSFRDVAASHGANSVNLAPRKVIEEATTFAHEEVEGEWFVVGRKL